MKFGKDKKGSASNDEEAVAIAPIEREGVALRATKTHPFAKEGAEFSASESVAAKCLKQGWAENISMILLLVVASFAANAQNFVGRELRFYNPLYSVITLAASDYIDTVTNTGTTYLSTITKSTGSAYTTTIQVNCTKISGTVAGTITIQGSIDNVNFKAIPTNETQTAVATATALDVASQTFAWRFTGSPYTYYRISWTGAGTMAASFTGYLMSH